ncbi:DUF4176 domain-containing protein [Mollicutes bacterium LVI A0078]|nr:DUF4176 domain-containing protein [Mollicutes bacterium LVI A0075]WOO91706.1 DUF4176 domain-containing protein [Mollicutes bacterium LVI A0078]
MKPIGTVIVNRELNNMQMIISYYPTNKENGKRYQYLTCLYPLGFTTDLPVCFVNEEDIELIAHTGLETVDFDNFAKALDEYIKTESSNENIEREIDMSQFTEL